MPPAIRQTITAEDLYELQAPSEARISPDGRSIVYSLPRVNRKTEKKFANLWIVPVTEAEGQNPLAPQQLTYGDQVDSHPRWSPDGRQIAFLSNRADAERPAQIYLLPLDGGEARPLTDLPGTTGDFAWSPDGKKLVLQVRKLDAEAVERLEDENKKKLGVVSRCYDRVFYKLDNTGYLPRERWHLWIVDVDTREAKQITDHAVYDETAPAWSPDGQWIAFLSNHSQDPDLFMDRVDLFVMPAGGGEMRRLETRYGEKSHPSFSPDGRLVAYYAMEGEGQPYRNTGLWITTFEPGANREPCNLTEPYDLHISSWTINDMGAPEITPPTWSLDGQRLYFPVVRHGNSQLLSVGVDGEGLQDVFGEKLSPGAVGAFDFDNRQERLAFLFGSQDDPGQVWIRRMPGGVPQRLTQHNRSLLDELDLGQLEMTWIQGPEGNSIQGWILKPPGFDPQKKYPSILEIHGGPLTQYGNLFMHEFYYLAAQGYVVHFCNPRGGRGYGQAHAESIWGSWGGADYNDLMAWTDYVEGLPFIDPQRMGVTGGSYGGYMTVWIIGHTQRFKAAVTQRCVSNFISLWGSSDFNWSFQVELGTGAPYENFEKYWDLSPLKYMGSAKTPTMVIHSENDLRCPIEQGEQVFVALKRQGVDTEFVRFPDEFHGLSRSGRTDRRIARLNHILRWFNRYLKDG